MYCSNIPYGSKSDDGGQTTTTCTSPDYYENGDCVSCPSDKICNTISGDQSVCQVGWYIKDNGYGNPKTCEPCEDGKYCEDGIVRNNANNPYLAKATYTEELLCFHGHSCTTSAETPCGTGEWAGPTFDGSTWTDRGSNTCTERDWLNERDLPGQNCPDQGNRSADRLLCTISDLDEERSAPTTTTACV